MSNIWNPHAFGVTGQPVGPQVNTLRVYGAEPSKEQLAMAQQTFAKFCMTERLSFAPNQTQQGFLPDGSKYRIVVVGNTRIMEVRVESVEGSTPKRGGIGISITGLNGELVPGHIHANGVQPQSYILTPEVEEGTRICTGKWNIRKVNGYNGGKAVWGNEAGDDLITGVEGVALDSDLLKHTSLDRIFGTNNRAYWAGDYYPGSRIFTDGEKGLGAFKDRVEIIPFFRKNSNGKLWVMSITPYFTPFALVLYGEEYNGVESTAPIGDAIAFFELPYAFIWQTITVSPDGNTIRLIMRKPGYAEYVKTEINVLDGGLAIASMIDAGSVTFGSQDTTTTGSQTWDGTFTRTVTYTPGWVTLPVGYGYDARGAETGFVLKEVFSGAKEDSLTHTVEVRESSGVLTDEDGSQLTEDFHSTISGTEKFPGISLDYGDRVVRFDRGGFTMSSSLRIFQKLTRDWSVPGALRTHVTRNGTETSERNEDNTSFVFIDTLNDFYIISQHIYKYTGVRVTDYEFNDPPGSPTGEVDNSSLTETRTYERRLVAVFKGNEILRVETPVSGDADLFKVLYAASSAIDPLTGAVCVNVLEIDTLAGDFAPPLRSWIILVDDVNAQLLSEVMTLPGDSTVRIKKDFALLSVV